MHVPLHILSAMTEDELVEVRTSDEYLAVSTGVLLLLNVSINISSLDSCIEAGFSWAN